MNTIKLKTIINGLKLMRRKQIQYDLLSFCTLLESCYYFLLSLGNY